MTLVAFEYILLINSRAIRLRRLRYHNIYCEFFGGSGVRAMADVAASRSAIAYPLFRVPHRARSPHAYRLSAPAL